MRKFDETLLSIGEAAKMYGVAPSTVGRWVSAGLITVIWTPGHQRRFRKSEIDAMIAASTVERRR
jgi:excisionase family DNA binding protein